MEIILTVYIPALLIYISIENFCRKSQKNFHVFPFKSLRFKDNSTYLQFPELDISCRILKKIIQITVKCNTYP